MSRREFLAMSSMGAAALALGTQGMWLPRTGLAQTSSRRPYSWNPATYPFKVGVASGDPELYDNASKASVLLWTRLVPGRPYIRPGDPALNELVEMQGDSLKGQRNLPVGLEVGIDGSNTGRQIEATAEEDFGHSVHQEVDGLEPGQRYWYRFTYEGQQSPVGYFKTPSTTLTRPLKFAFGSCQRWTSAYYTAYRAIAGRTDSDLVVHLGDYIYEAAPSTGTVPEDLQHSAIEPSSEWCETLFDYRTRHAQYKTDLDLQDAHAAHLWLVTWDDHEVENDYSNTKSWYTSLSELNARRLAAYQAYYEHMPIRYRPRAGEEYVVEKRDGAGMLQGVENINLNRQVTYGNPSAPLEIQFLVLDSRPLRTEQPCPEQAGGSLIETNCTERTQDPILRSKQKVRRHTILSAEGDMNLSSPWSQDVQENWLKTRLTSSPRWNVLAQQIPMYQYNHYDWSGNYYYDAWDAYTAVRSRIFNHIAQNSVPNAVVLTGDMHSAWAANLEKNFNDTTRTDVVATEFCATSISSGLGVGWDSTYRNAFGRKGNTHVKFYDGRTGGYGLCTVDKDKWTMEYYLGGSSTPIKTYWVYAKGSGPFGSYGLIDPNTNRPA